MSHKLDRWRVGNEVIRFASFDQPEYCLRPDRERVQHCMDILRAHTLQNDLPAQNSFLGAGGDWTIWGQGMSQHEACTLTGEPYRDLVRLEDE